MPALVEPDHKNYIDIPCRKAVLAAETDVLVVGGGPAGLGASLGAAAAGAKVILVEQYGFCGGHATVCLVNPFMSFYTNEGEPVYHNTVFPTDHGPGRPVVGGVLQKLINRLIDVGGALRPSPENGFTLPFDPEILKRVYEDMVDEAGVDYLLHSFACDTVMKGRSIDSVIFLSKSGPLSIKASVAIDCTGDGDIAALSGAPFEIGRRKDGLVQPATLIFRMVDFDKREFDNYLHGHPGQWSGVQGLTDLIEEASRRGDLDLAREDILFFGSVREREITVNSTRVNVLGTDVWDLSRAEREGRSQMAQIENFLRKYVPGFGRSYAVQSGASIAVRETRRVTGEYVMTEDDVLQARSFGDVIARGTYPIDIHNPKGKGTVLKRVPQGKAYDIPLRCLTPLGVDNLMIAGKCISGSHEAFSSYRIMATSVATGQAAGVCAALSARSGVINRKVPARDVQDELLRQGAFL